MLLDSLAMDSSNSVNPVQREDLINSMNLLRTTSKNIQIQKNIYETGKRDSMAIFNDALLATEIRMLISRRRLNLFYCIKSMVLILCNIF
jgi:hypothetical protein